MIGLIPSIVIWTHYDWLNKFYNLYMTAVVSISLVGMALELKCVVEATPVRQN